MDDSVLDDIINRLFDVRGRPTLEVQLPEFEIRHLCAVAREIFLQEPSLLELKRPINVCGDIRGQFKDLLYILKSGGDPPASTFLFMGNYVGRGNNSLETICLLLAFKVRYPENIFLLTGTDECSLGYCKPNIYHECKSRSYPVLVWKMFQDCFDCLPVAAVISKEVFCVHSGLSPRLHSLEDIKNITRPIKFKKDLRKKDRHKELDLLEDLLLTNPSTRIKGWGQRKGVTYEFGADKVREFLDKNRLDFMCRGHEPVKNGWDNFADGQLVTIFSAQNYRGKGNKGSYMRYNEPGKCCHMVYRVEQVQSSLDAKASSKSKSGKSFSYSEHTPWMGPSPSYPPQGMYPGQGMPPPTEAEEDPLSALGFSIINTIATKLKDKLEL